MSRPLSCGYISLSEMTYMSVTKQSYTPRSRFQGRFLKFFLHRNLKSNPTFTRIIQLLLLSLTIIELMTSRHLCDKTEHNFVADAQNWESR